MNVGPNDLAKIVAPFRDPGCGQIVRVLRAYVPGEEVGGVECAGPFPAWVCFGFVRIHVTGEDNKPVERTLGPEVVISDHCLRRVEPPAASGAT